MKNSDLLLAANTLWVVKNGGTHGSPVGPLLLRRDEIGAREAAAVKARLRRPGRLAPAAKEALA
jgi:hypothetical protein